MASASKVVLDRKSTPFYERQLERAAAWARMDRSTASAMTVATARMAARTQPTPDKNIRFVLMTWQRRDKEILPAYLSQMDGPSLPATLGPLDQRNEYKGSHSAEAALAAAPDGVVAVPTTMLDLFVDAKLTPAPSALRGGLEL